MKQKNIGEDFLKRLKNQEDNLNFNIKMKGQALEFLNEIDMVNGYVDYVQSLELIHHYLNHFPAIFDLKCFSLEDELIICYDRLKRLRKYNEENDPQEYYSPYEDEETEEIKAEKRIYQRDRNRAIIKNESPDDKKIRLKKARKYQRDRREIDMIDIFNEKKKKYDYSGYRKKYYQKNKEDIRQKQNEKNSTEEAKELNKARYKKYYEKNKKTIKEKRRITRIKNKLKEQI